MQLDIINQVASSRNYDSAEGGIQKISSVFYISRKSSLFKKEVICPGWGSNSRKVTQLHLL